MLAGERWKKSITHDGARASRRYSSVHVDGQEVRVTCQHWLRLFPPTLRRRDAVEHGRAACIAPRRTAHNFVHTKEGPPKSRSVALEAALRTPRARRVLARVSPQFEIESGASSAWKPCSVAHTEGGAIPPYSHPAGRRDRAIVETALGRARLRPGEDAADAGWGLDRGGKSVRRAVQTEGSGQVVRAKAERNGLAPGTSS